MALPLPTLAVIELSFEPVVEVGGVVVRWQAVGVAVALLVALLVAALTAARVRGGRALSVEDVLYVALAAVPGAALGGRLVHALTFLDHYAADPARLLDPLVGSLSLLGAVIGGIASASVVAVILDRTTRRWADVAAVPLLLVLGLGKLAQALGGSGQGAGWDGAWATAYHGAGPWVGPDPGLPSHPAQVYEGLATLLGAPLVVLAAFAVGPRRRAGSVADGPPRADAAAPSAVDLGRLLPLAVAWWLVVRVLVGFVWRDPRALGPLNVEQLVASAILVLAAGAWLVRRTRSGVRAAPRGGDGRRAEVRAAPEGGVSAVARAKGYRAAGEAGARDAQWHDDEGSER